MFLLVFHQPPAHQHPGVYTGCVQSQFWALITAGDRHTHACFATQPYGVKWNIYLYGNFKNRQLKLLCAAFQNVRLHLSPSLFFKQQPMRAKHCQTCKRCVRRFDHHCPWIENCVGERNHRWFIVYLLVQLLALLWALHIALYVTVKCNFKLQVTLRNQSCRL